MGNVDLTLPSLASLYSKCIKRKKVVAFLIHNDNRLLDNQIERFTYERGNIFMSKMENSKGLECLDNLLSVTLIMGKSNQSKAARL